MPRSRNPAPPARQPAAPETPAPQQPATPQSKAPTNEQIAHDAAARWKGELLSFDERTHEGQNVIKILLTDGRVIYVPR